MKDGNGRLMACRTADGLPKAVAEKAAMERAAADAAAKAAAEKAAMDRAAADKNAAATVFTEPSAPTLLKVWPGTAFAWVVQPRLCMAAPAHYWLCEAG